MATAGRGARASEGARIVQGALQAWRVRNTTRDILEKEAREEEALRKEQARQEEARRKEEARKEVERRREEEARVNARRREEEARRKELVAMRQAAEAQRLQMMGGAASLVQGAVRGGSDRRLVGVRLLPCCALPLPLTLPSHAPGNGCCCCRSGGPRGQAQGLG